MSKINKFYPSYVKNKIYEVMEEHEKDSFYYDTYKATVIEAICNILENDDTVSEAIFDSEESGDMVFLTYTFAWIESGHLQSISFYVEG